MRRFGGPLLLLAGGIYWLMAAAGNAAPPAVSATATPLAYTENDPAVLLDPGFTLSEPELDDILSATVRITGNYQAGADVLAFSDQLGIHGAWNPGTGVLTLSGIASAADYETAIRSVTYQNTSDNPSTLQRTVTFVVTDVNNESGADTRAIDITPVDDPLDVTATGGSLAYTEGAGAVPVDSGFTIVDPDDDVVGATVAFDPLTYQNGEDELGFTNQLGITGTWDAATGTLTLSGTASVADYQTALRSVTYTNTSKNPTVTPRTVLFTVNTATTDSANRVIAITAVNDAPEPGGDTTVTAPGGGPANVLEDENPSAANIRLTPPVLTDVDGATPTQVRIISVTGGTLQQADGSAIGLGTGGSLLSLAGGSVDLRFIPEPNRDTAASFEYVVVDAGNPGLNSSPSVATVPIVPVNDAPTLSMSSGSVAFVENAGAVVIDAAATIGDIDSANLASVTLQITGNYNATEDVLAFTDSGGITGSWDANTGTLTLTGPASPAVFQAALRTVEYDNTSENPSTETRTVSVTVDDGLASSNVATRSITVTAVNDAPVVTPTGANAIYTENDAAIPVDAGVDVIDVDTPTLTGATVQITGNYANGEDVLAFTSQLGIIGSWDASSGTLTLAGTTTVANYQAALRSVTYVNTSDAPSTAPRTVTFVVHDGTDPSAPSTRGITVNAVNDPPQLVGSSGDLTFVENASPIEIDTGFTVTDPDDTHLEGATVAITAGYWNGEDVLEFVDQSGITGSWDATTGVLTLTGAATLADYENALRSVTYVNTSDAPSSAPRTITTIVDDGDDLSAAATRTIEVVPVNDVPVVSLASGMLTYTEDDPPVALDATLTLDDPDDASLARATVTISSGYVLGQDVLDAAAGGGVSASFDAQTGTLTLSGNASPATYQTVLRGVTFRNNSQKPTAGARTLSVVVEDPSGPSATVTRGVTVVSVNDAPVAADDTATTLQGVAVTVDVLRNDSDVEGDPLAVTAVSTAAGGTATITSTGDVRVDPDRSFSGTLTFTYTVSDGAATDTGALTVTVVPTADVVASVSATPNPAYAGDDVTVSVVFRNSGPGVATGGVVELDAGGQNRAVVASTAGGACTVAGATARCTLPDVVAGATALVEVTVRPTTTGTMNLHASVSSAVTDPDPDDNAASASVRVVARAIATPGPAPTTPPRRRTSPPANRPATGVTTTSTSSTTTTTTPESTTTTSTPDRTTTTTKPHASVTSPANDQAREREQRGSGSGTWLLLSVMVAAAVATAVVALRRQKH